MATTSSPPSAIFQWVDQEDPNFLPAGGETFSLDNPSNATPPASQGMLDDLIHIWRSVGSPLEPPTGFSSGPSSALLQSRGRPGFGFQPPSIQPRSVPGGGGFEGFGRGMGRQRPNFERPARRTRGTPGDTQMQDGSSTFMDALKAAAKFGKEVFAGGDKVGLANGVEPWLEQTFGKEPGFNLSGKGVTDLPFEPSNFDLVSGLPSGDEMFGLDPSLYAPFTDAGVQQGINALVGAPDPTFSLLNPGGSFLDDVPLSLVNDLNPEAILSGAAGTNGATSGMSGIFSNMGPSLAAAGISAAVPLVTEELGLTDNQSKVASAGTSLSLAALGMMNPATMMLTPLMFAAPSILEDIGIIDENDAQAQAYEAYNDLTNNLMNTVSMTTSVSTMPDDQFSAIYNTYYGDDPVAEIEAQIAELESSGYIPQEQIDATRKFLKSLEPMFTALETGTREEAVSVAPPITGVPNSPVQPLSEEEAWRQYTQTQDYYDKYVLPQILADQNRSTADGGSSSL